MIDRRCKCGNVMLAYNKRKYGRCYACKMNELIQEKK